MTHEKKPRMKPRTGWLETPKSRTIWNGRRSQGLGKDAVRVTIRDARDPAPDKVLQDFVQHLMNQKEPYYYPGLQDAARSLGFELLPEGVGSSNPQGMRVRVRRVKK